MDKYKKRFLPLLSALFLLSGPLSNQAFSAEPDPISQYIFQGDIVPKWTAYTGNSLNYFVPYKNGTSTTERKSLIVSEVNEDDSKAINLKWTGKTVKNEWGGNQLGNSFFSIGRNIIDISSVQDVAALAFEIKVKRAPKDNVKLSMQCNYSNKCTGEFSLKPILRRLKKDTWQTLPIPLNCFNKDGKFDFSKVTNILSLATEGKLEVAIRNVQLIGMAQGDKGCKA